MSEAGLVRRTIGILRAVAAHPQGIGLSDVAREAGIPKATCYRVLSVLERESWLTVDPHTRRYRVSLGLLSVVGGLLDRDGAYGHMRAVLAELAEETQESAGFDVLLPPNVMVVAQVSGPFLIAQTRGQVPRTQPVWTTSTGKVLMAALPPDVVRAEYGADFAAHPPANYADVGQFLAALDEVRRRGFAIAYDELEVGAAAVAAPVRVRDAVPYAVWIGGPTYRITRDRIDGLAEAVVKAANRLSQLLSITDLDLPVR